MQIKTFWISFFVTLLLILSTASSKAQSQDVATDSVMRLQDSLNRAYLQDSIRQVFATKYTALIYDNPYREGFLDHRLRAILDTAPGKLLVWDEYLSKSSNDSIAVGIDRAQRPLWVFGTAMLLFLCVGMIRFIFPAEFHIIIDAYYRERLLQQISKEDSMATSWPYVFLYTIFSLALGLFIVVYMSSFRDAHFLTFGNYMRASGLIAVLFILKILLVRFISFVFGLQRLIREYITVIYLVYFNSILFLLPFLLFIILSPTAYFNIILILFVLSISIMFVYRVLRTVLNVFGQTRFSISYLIIYLCTLEIAPILLLIRALGN
ncbi:DUF4271 domain-containing protein [Sphingobacterium sp. lm-10]|uniref:DUF4271 domain-containing protein n=1 Tax=Sphingobacterium sp. lm-10 TaxID=2944904 RepID=UPI002020020D|nr:DUF4271 domain-containing protein [Sphingobacterium sp. lm-10]MCL7989361.1 DUF4271 domain-containing protein [Sphingobacterium sp. lm-10]